jgi:hypothetical protein
LTIFETPTAGLAYLADTVADSLLADYEKWSVVIAAVPSIVAEGWFGLWLLLTKRIQEDPSCP